MPPDSRTEYARRMHRVLQFDATPCVAHDPVGSTYDPVSGVFDCEIVIPVAPL